MLHVKIISSPIKAFFYSIASSVLANGLRQSINYWIKEAFIILKVNYAVIAQRMKML